MKSIIIIILFLMLLPDCNPTFYSRSKSSKPIKTASTGTPMYLDEGQYAGDQLELIKLINLRMKYLWEVDETSYMKLFHKESPINGIPLFKIKSTTLRSEITIREHKNVYQAVVSVTELRYDNAEEENPTYVFQKDKTKGAEWRIRDID